MVNYQIERVSNIPNAKENAQFMRKLYLMVTFQFNPVGNFQL